MVIFFPLVFGDYLVTVWYMFGILTGHLNKFRETIMHLPMPHQILPILPYPFSVCLSVLELKNPGVGAALWHNSAVVRPKINNT